jgi:hypothetical protein
MADNQTSGAGKGRGRAGDQTSQPGQASGLLPFGISNPLGTGAPGTSGGAPGPQDPTTVPGQVPGSVFGASTDTKTGAPGSAGASTSVATGASYTDPFAHLSGGNSGNMTGGSVDTESQGNKYGSSTMPGIAGSGSPKDTGVGHGTLSHDHNGVN